MASDEKSTSFVNLVNTHKGIIYKVALAYCKDPDDRNDLIQEIMIQLWKSFDNYDDTYKHSTWIYRISLNVAISFYHKETRRKHIANPIHEGLLNYTETYNNHETEERIQALQQFIAELKDLDKALMLLYLEEKSYKEIAGIMGMTETNVATRISRIKLILKQKFSSASN
ncbi:RNA polymerase sigma factor [Emticicia sp. 17c]|uniref:RNA polymerase sigma factor n=1 Tax=Emticicia sp. 17c TaxID=3127704 RepID=UPI00301BCEE3